MDNEGDADVIMIEPAATAAADAGAAARSAAAGAAGPPPSGSAAAGSVIEAYVVDVSDGDDGEPLNEGDADSYFDEKLSELLCSALSVVAIERCACV